MISLQCMVAHLPQCYEDLLIPTKYPLLVTKDLLVQSEWDIGYGANCCPPKSILKDDPRPQWLGHIPDRVMGIEVSWVRGWVYLDNQNGICAS